MKLRELLPILTHQNYKIFVQTDLNKITNSMIELKTIDDIKNHFDCNVLSLDESWNIIIKSSGIV